MRRVGLSASAELLVDIVVGASFYFLFSTTITTFQLEPHLAGAYNA